jgi:redox-sensitive bicupin YhaK (pirin superfamily)
MATSPRPAGRRLFLQGSVQAAALALAGVGRAAVKTQRRPVQILPGLATSDGAGVRLTRVIGQRALPDLDPFLLLDRFHSDDPSAYIAGFPDHPHRGFETVTVMLEGHMRHRDSRGNAGLITGGGVQWMTAGRGIIHSEMPEQERGLMSGFQLWVNLPARQKMSAQAYQDLPPARIAQARLAGGSVLRVASGNVDGLRGPVRPRPTDPLLLTLALEDDRPFELAVPTDHTAFLFVASGEVSVGDEQGAVPAQHLAVLSPGNRVRVRATNRRSQILLAAARPLGEPIARRGPFVMNTEAELDQAVADYRAGVLDR